jgi:hypothetical protein
MDDFSLVQTIDRFCQRIVIGVPDTADGWLETCIGETLNVFYGQVLASAIGVMDQAASGYSEHCSQR